MKTTVYIAASLDGFIARADGDVDWLGEPPEDGEDYGYQEFIDTVDFLVMGRNTYEKVLSFGQWPYTKPVIVLTSRALDIPGDLAGKVETMSGSPAEIVGKLSQRGAKHLYIDGGKTIQSFIDAGFIQRICITRIPILLGNGIPLFGPLQQDIKLRHVQTQAFADGKVQCDYEVVR